MITSIECKIFSTINNIYPIVKVIQTEMNYSDNDEYKIKGIAFNMRIYPGSPHKIFYLPDNIFCKYILGIKQNNTYAVTGYISHILLLICHYLEIYLKYPIFFQGSHSFIINPFCHPLPKRCVRCFTI